MKKLFSFKSYSNNNSSAPPPVPNHYYRGNTLDNGLFSQDAEEEGDHNPQKSRRSLSRPKRPQSENNSSGPPATLQRCRSMSRCFLDDEPGEYSFAFANDPSVAPSNAASPKLMQYSESFRSTSVTPERRPRPKKSEAAANQGVLGSERPGSPGSSKLHRDSYGNSSYSSSTNSSKVIDRYIDGEQHQESSRPKKTSQKKNSGNGNLSLRPPPRMQCTAPTSPTGAFSDKPRSYSFREVEGTRPPYSSKELTDNSSGRDSPRKFAKDVVERLSRTRPASRPSSRQSDRDDPITIQDIYSGPMRRHLDSKIDMLTQSYGTLDVPYATVNSCGEESFSRGQKQNLFYEANPGRINSFEPEDDTGMELRRRFNEAEERVMLISEELKQENFFQDRRFGIPSIVQTIRHFTEEKMNLSLEVSALLQSRISERAILKEELRATKTELESQTRKLEKQKNELQTSLEKEIDRRSSDWSLKLEKYQIEEQKLRDRVRELAEQNVALQRELSSLNEKEDESRSMITYLEQQLNDLNGKAEQASDGNDEMQKNLTELQDKYRVVEGDARCLQRNFEEKDRECRELHKSVSRLLRTCNEQEKTIEGLREVHGEDIEKKQLEKFDKRMVKLQREQMRLAGVELALRRELESYRLEADSLRQENINILSRLKVNGNEVAAMTFKLDQEIRNRLSCLQNQGLAMLSKSSLLCAKLLDILKRKAIQLQDIQQVVDSQFIIETDQKVQGFKVGTESLRRSLETVSTVLQEKSDGLGRKLQTGHTQSSVSENLNGHQASEGVLRDEFKTEILLTKLLREKLYAKEMEVEQLQAELAAAVRGNDILKCEVQNAVDNVSCLSHRCKDLELQIRKKDEITNCIQNDLQESTKELSILKGILPKVSEERDMMWEKVKQYSESNMLLNSQVEVLKKKIETLDEDILLKEGQITILKDAIGNKEFDLLPGHDSKQEFFFK